MLLPFQEGPSALAISITQHFRYWFQLTEGPQKYLDQGEEAGPPPRMTGIWICFTGMPMPLPAAPNEVPFHLNAFFAGFSRSDSMNLPILIHCPFPSFNELYRFSS